MVGEGFFKTAVFSVLILGYIDISYINRMLVVYSFLYI